jgi:hypothetical protein
MEAAAREIGVSKNATALKCRRPALLASSSAIESGMERA